MGGKKGLKNCSVCDYKHKLISQVRRHEAQSHGKHAVKCTECEMPLPYNRLARHIREEHTNLLEKINLSNHQTVKDKIVDDAEIPDKECEDGRSSVLSSYNGSSSSSSVSPCLQESSNNNDTGKNDDNSQTSFADIPMLDSTAACGVFKCHYCKKIMKNRNSLRKHVNTVHEKNYKQTERKKKYQCSWPGCHKAFVAPCMLADHNNTHTGEKPYSCDHCKKEFAARSLFSVHLRKYHGVTIRQMSDGIERCIENGLLQVDSSSI